MRCITTKPTKCPVRPVMTDQPWASDQPDQSLLSAQWEAEAPRFIHADCETDQTRQLPRLTQVFTGSTGHFVVFAMIWLKLLYFGLISVLQPFNTF